MMLGQNKAQHLVVDTSAFIKNLPLQDLAANVYTVQGVVDEISNKRQLRSLVVLPYDLKIKDVFAENIKFVTEFSKKTGDYSSLSAVDIQVMALTYQLEKEHVGTDHLHLEPQVLKVANFSEETSRAYRSIAGFYLPSTKEKQETRKSSLKEETDRFESDKEEEDKETLDDEELQDVYILGKSKAVKDTNKNEEKENVWRKGQLEEDILKIPGIEQVKYEETDEVPRTRICLPGTHVDEDDVKELEEELHKVLLEDLVENKDCTAVPEDVNDVSKYEEEDDIWNDNDWITPENVNEVKLEMGGAELEDEATEVACITGDFSMQNVLRQLGLKVLALDGRIIKQLRTYILRCYACFKTTSRMQLLFCPHCGNRTLRRAAVVLRPDGSQEVLVSFRRPPTGRGKRFSLPRPQGGKHANNPLLCPDQRIPQQVVSRLARAKNNPLEPDYIAGFSPFLMRDVNSKSAVLGIGCAADVKNWMRRNPNSRKKGKKQRK